MRHAHDVGVAEELVAEIVAEFEPRQGLAQVPGSRPPVPGERGRRRLKVTLRGAEEIPHGSAREESANEMVDARRRRRLEGGEPIEPRSRQQGPGHRPEPRDSATDGRGQRGHHGAREPERGRAPEMIVAPEDLVAPEAREHHREPGFSSRAGDAPGIEPVDRGLVHGSEEGAQVGEDVGRAQQHLVVIGADPRCHAPGVRRFRESPLLEGHGERGQGLRPAFRGQRRERGRVDASREEDAEGHVADEVQAHRLFEPLAGRDDRVRGRPRRRPPRGFHGAVEIPVALDAGAAGADLQDVPGREGAHVLDRGQGRRHASPLEKARESFAAGLVGHQAAADDGRDLGSEEHAPAVLMPVERLDAEPVAGEEKRGRGPRLKICEPEHAPQPGERRLSPRVEGAEQHLGVAPRAEALGRAELGAQLAIVVRLSVVGEPPAPVG